MKKQYLLLVGTILCGALATGCTINLGGGNTPENKVATTATEAQVTNGNNAEPKENTERFNNVQYSLGGNWRYKGEESETRAYIAPGEQEAFAIYVQNETSYTAAAMVEAYEKLITDTYSANYSIDTEKYAGLDWSVYTFDYDVVDENTVCTDVYLYTDGATTIYIENSYKGSVSPSGNIYDVLNSITIDDQAFTTPSNKVSGSTTAPTTGNGSVIVAYDDSYSVEINSISGFSETYTCEYFVDLENSSGVEAEYSLGEESNVSDLQYSFLDSYAAIDYTISNQDTGTFTNDSGDTVNYSSLSFTDGSTLGYAVQYLVEIKPGNFMEIQVTSYDGAITADEYAYLADRTCFTVK